MVNNTKKSSGNSKIIGAALGLGAQLREAANGPEVLEIENIIKTLDFSEQKEFAKGKAVILPLLDFYKKLSDEIIATLNEKKFPIIVGGDHSIAISTWSTVINKLNAFDDFGLIWIDAHLDSHIFETSPSKAYHGMPVAHLLGYGEPEFSGFLSERRKINPKYLVFIGARSFEQEEKELLDKLRVRIITMQEIRERGFAECLQEALTIANSAKRGFGVSIDIDFFDPKYAPGVGSPAVDGANPTDVLPILDVVYNHPHLKALEIAEFNPARDINNITKELCLNLMFRINN